MKRMECGTQDSQFIKKVSYTQAKTVVYRLSLSKAWEKTAKLDAHSKGNS